MLHLITRSVPLVPKTYDENAHAVRVTVASEQPTEVFDWERMEVVTEVLLVSGFQLPEGRSQVPLIDSHDRWTIERMLGSARDFSVTGTGEVAAVIHFDSTEEGRAAETKVSEGHLTDISAGYRVNESVWIPAGQKQTIQGREFTGPLKVATRWTIKEVSLTPVGADTISQVRSEMLPVRFREMLIARGMSADATDDEMLSFLRRQFTNSNTNTTTDGGRTMGDENKGTQPSAEEVQRAEKARLEKEQAERAEFQRKERERVVELDAMAALHGERVKDMGELKRQAVSDGWSADKFSREILSRIEKSKPVDTADAPAPGKVAVRELVKPWQKRSVLAMNALVAEARGNSRAAEYRSQLMAMMRAVTPEQEQAELREAADIIEKANISPMQQMRLLSTLSSGAGGALLPAPFLAEVFVIVEERGLARRLFRPIPMGSKTLDLKNIATKPTAYWVDEGSNITASDLGFGTGQLVAKKLAGITSWTSELEEDNAIAFIPLVQELFGEAIFTKEDDAGFVGDGTSGYGSFTGVLNFGTVITTMAAGLTAFDNVTADHLRTVRDSLSLAKRRGAIWMLHPDILSIVEGLKDLQGRYIYRGPGESRPGLLWGYPIANNTEGIESMPAASASAANKKFIAFGNPSYFLMGMRRELDLEISREAILNSAADAITFNAFQADGALLKMTERIAFQGAVASAFAVLRTAAA